MEAAIVEWQRSSEALRKSMSSLFDALDQYKGEEEAP